MSKLGSSRTTLLCSLFVLLLLVACGKTAEKSASPSSAPSSASQPAPTPPVTTSAPVSTGAVIASSQYSADPDLRCDLLEVKRVSGGALLVRWRFVNTAAAAGSTGLVAGAQPKTIYYDFGWEQLYYTDPAENKKYGFLTDSEGNRILDMWWGSLPAGQQRAMWAKFPAPPPTSTKITVQIPKFSPFEDVPVS